jgi:aryl-alcohol dehydrogenase-like predicted oxidoreductase
MKTRTLSRGGLEVAEIGYGAMGLSGRCPQGVACS